MGKAIITENLKEGRYQIEYRYNSAVIEKRIAAIAVEIGENGNQTVATQVLLDAALLKMRALDLALNGVLSSTTLTLAEKEQQSRAIVKQLQDQRLVVLGHQGKIASLKATRIALLLENQRLAKVPQTKTRSVWSADYSPDLSVVTTGEVGTIEVPGEEQEVLLYPAKNQFRTWEPKTDGDMTPVAAQSPMAWLYNTCVVTGWQTYRPTFRFAKVVEIKNATHMRVELIPPLESTYGTKVTITPKHADQTFPVYTDVVCDYLDCHTAAFVVGDEVVVQYMAQNPDEPKVIGFRRNPQPCAALNFYTAANDRLRVDTAGTAWVQSPFDAPLFGDTYWVGEKRAVSWRGKRLRLVPVSGSFAADEAGSPEVYSQGRLLATAPAPVLGAAIVGSFLVVVCGEAERDAAYATPLLTTPTGPWQLIASYATGGAMDPYSPAGPFPSRDPWVFSASGMRAACCKRTGYGGPIYALVTLVLSVTGAGITGNFTVTNAAYDTITTVYEHIDHSTGVVDWGRPTDCVIDIDHTEQRTYKNVAVEFVGEAMHLFDLVWDIHNTVNATYGPAFNDCHVGGNGFAATASGTNTSTQTVRLVCPVLAVDLTLSAFASTESFVASSYGVPADNDLGCAPVYEYESSGSATQVGFALEHLNATAGADKVILLGRRLNLGRTSSTSIHEGAFAVVPGYAVHNTSTQTTTGTQTLEMHVGLVTSQLSVLPVNQTVTETSEPSEAISNIRYLCEYATPYDIAWAACDRQGHLLYSSPLFNVVRGVPALPGAAAGGNHNRFVSVGVG